MPGILSPFFLQLLDVEVEDDVEVGDDDDDMMLLLLITPPSIRKYLYEMGFNARCGPLPSLGNSPSWQDSKCSLAVW